MATRFTTVRVFQDAIFRLADDPSDPIVHVMEQLADEIRECAEENIAKIFRDTDTGVRITVDVGQDTRGLFFRLTPDGEGNLSSYLTWKEAREHAWFAPCVEQAVGRGGVRTPVGVPRGTFPRGAGFTL